MRSARTLRRTRLALVLALAMIAALALAAAATAETRPTCKRAHSKTVAENRSARIFEGRLGPRGGVRSRRLFGCWKRTGSAQLLTRRFDRCVPRGQSGLIRLRGRFAAFYSTSFVAERPDGCAEINPPIRHFLTVVNLRNRSRFIIEVPGRPAASRLHLSPGGAIVWPSWLPQNQVEVLVVDTSAIGEPVRDDYGDATGDRHGTPYAIDSGPIHPESVRLRRGGGVRWHRDDVPNTEFIASLTTFMR